MNDYADMSDEKRALREKPVLTEDGFSYRRNLLQTRMHRLHKIMQKQIYEIVIEWACPICRNYWSESPV